MDDPITRLDAIKQHRLATSFQRWPTRLLA
jgi:hypothetical protein